VPLETKVKPRNAALVALSTNPKDRQKITWNSSRPLAYTSKVIPQYQSGDQ
jgi:hypothetical protein